MKFDEEVMKVLAHPTATAKDTARVLNVCERTVNRLVRSNELPSFRVGRQIRIPTASLKRMLGLEPEVAA